MVQIRPVIRNLTSYSTEEESSLLRFHANESPYEVPGEILDTAIARASKLNFHQYPDPDCGEIKELLAKNLGLKTDNLIFGNGSDELIGMIIQAFCGDGDKVLIPVPTFAMYKQIAIANNVSVAEVKLNTHFDIPGNFFEKIEFFQPKVVFLSYPNNPTGNLFTEEVIEKLLEDDSILTVIDEAYFHFSEKSFIDRVSEKKNLVVLRSFSKVGFAGLRIGYLAAHEELAKDLDKVRLPYNINTFSQVLLAEALKNWGLVEKSTKVIIADRDAMVKELSNINYLEVCKTSANFILLKVNNFKASYIYNVLKDNGILVRHFEGSDMLEHYIRVSVNKKKVNKKLIEVLQGIE